MNEYIGYEVPLEESKRQVETVRLEDLDSQTSSSDGDASHSKTIPDNFASTTFFETYVKCRKPVVIDGLIPELAHVKERWSKSFFQKLAGDAQVDIEVSPVSTKVVQGEYNGGKSTGEGDGSGDRPVFGLGKKEEGIKFSDILDRLAAGDSSFYLSTQKTQIDAGSGLPRITASPITELVSANEICLKPRILGNLITSNINIWMGNSPKGTCTGLHHDYHDNLYILLNGRKRFELFSPADALKLYTHGEISRVHKNGRINYTGIETDADGSHDDAVNEQRAALRTKLAEIAVREAEAAVEQNLPGSKERLRKAEEELDDALCDILETGNDEFDDFDELSENDEEEETESLSGTEERQTKRLKVSSNDPPDNPLNFSKVDLRKENIDGSEYSLFKYARKLTCELLPGQMLFLPAGWFHCVTSFSDEESAASNILDFGGHVAINYWMHPPSNEDYSSPYSNDYWLNDWKLRGPNPT